MLVGRRLGFTLIEILVAIGVLAVLGIVGGGAYVTQIPKSRDGQRRSDLHTLTKALEAYVVNSGCYPHASAVSCSGTTLSSELTKIPCDPKSKTPYFYIPYPADPDPATTHNTSVCHSAYWLLADLEYDSDKDRVSTLTQNCGRSGSACDLLVASGTLPSSMPSVTYNGYNTGYWGGTAIAAGNTPAPTTTPAATATATPTPTPTPTLVPVATATPTPVPVATATPTPTPTPTPAPVAGTCPNFNGLTVGQSQLCNITSFFQPTGWDGTNFYIKCADIQAKGISNINCSQAGSTCSFIALNFIPAYPSAIATSTNGSIISYRTNTTCGTRNYGVHLRN